MVTGLIGFTFARHARIKPHAASIDRADKRNAPCCSRVAEQKGALETNQTKLIFVQDYAINHHAVAGSDIMNADWYPDFDLGFYHICIQDLAASGHICNRLAEAISARSAGLLQNDLTARTVLRDRPAALGRGSCCRGLRDLCPCERRNNCQRHAQ